MPGTTNPRASTHSANRSHVAQRPPATTIPAGRPKLRYELLGCAVHGHELVDQRTAAASGRGELLYRGEPATPAADPADVADPGRPAAAHSPAFGWFRCLRCDTWVPLTTAHQPSPRGGELTVPLRGRPLRDRFVLRAIAVDRVVHFLLIGAVAVAIFVFADHRSGLRGSYTRILNRLQGTVGDPLSDTTHTGLLHDVDRLFAVSTTRLYLYGIAIAVYAAVNGIEAVGLWRARRWAEYLTLVEVAVLLPVEIHELTVRVSPLKILTLLINLAVIGYLLWAHRLFGVRGGGRADQAEKDRDTGWEPLRRSTPWASPMAPDDLVERAVDVAGNREATSPY